MTGSRTTSRRAAKTLPRLDQRTAGILMHPTSLPGPYGSGDLGPEAFRFMQFLAAAGHRWWQMLPIGPIGIGNSPYNSISAFAGGWHLISPDYLLADKLVTPTDIKRVRSPSKDRVTFPPVLRFRYKLLRQAFDRFKASRRKRTDYERFCEENREWLDDFTLFCTLRHVHKNAAWPQWHPDLVTRKAAALREARRVHHDRIEFEQFLQYVFDRQWLAFKRYCNSLGQGLIGDMPIFVCHDSADAWANQSLYLLDRHGNPTVVSGVPPDYFSKTGQLWGQPLYDWKNHARTDYRWWVARFANLLQRFDVIRIDHFLGFNRLWNVPARAKTAIHGTWTKSPGDEIFAAVKKTLGDLRIIAEDLGLLIPEAAALRDRWGMPGMRVIQFAFQGDKKCRHDQPHRYTPNSVAYTGTHDNNTTVGWFKSLPKRGRRGPDGLNSYERVLRYTGTDGKKIHEDMIRLVYASVSNTAIIPMQDALGLDAKARMNFPSTIRGNWQWRMRPDATSEKLAAKLRALVKTYEREDN